MATYPGAIPTIPDNGTWTHTQVGDEVEAIAGELGVNPSGSQATVLARFTAVEGRVTTLEGAASVAGVEVGSAQLTADYSILGQSPNTTFTDVGLSVAVGAQTRAYMLSLDCLLVAVTSSSFVATKLASPALRIVNSGVTEVADVGQFPIVMTQAGAVTYLTRGALRARIPAGRAATTWKVQARIGAPTIDAQVTSLGIFARASLGAPAGGVTQTPAHLQAITV